MIALYALLPVGCLLLNGLFEAAEPLLSIGGMPGIEACRKQIFKKSNI